MGLGSNKSSNEVTYLDEIVEELSEEFDIDVKEMKELCYNSLDYIKHLTKKKETMGIILPHLGVLYFSRAIGRFFRDLYKEEASTVQEERNNIVYRLEQVEKSSTKVHNKKPFLYRFKRIVKKKGYELPKMGTTKGQKEFWSTVSEMQNEINND